MIGYFPVNSLLLHLHIILCMLLNYYLKDNYRKTYIPIQGSHIFITWYLGSPSLNAMSQHKLVWRGSRIV